MPAVADYKLRYEDDSYAELVLRRRLVEPILHRTYIP
jgi:hypothetical protein